MRTKIDYSKKRGAKPWYAVVLTALCTVLVLLPATVAAEQFDIELPDIDDIECASYLAYDLDADEPLVAKDADKRIYPASMTKVLTFALALDYLSLDDKVMVSHTAMDATTPNSTMMGLSVGEEVLVSELLYGLMLPSGNDAANVLAEAIVSSWRNTPDGEARIEELTRDYHAAQSAEDDEVVSFAPTHLELFTVVMNDKIAALGLQNTYFINPNGLHHEDHYTTASDLVELFRDALRHDAFLEVISAPSHAFLATNKNEYDGWQIIRHTNRLLTDPWILGQDTHIAKVLGGKTGTTIFAGTGMIFMTVNQNGHEMVTVVCGIPYKEARRQTVYCAAIANEGARICFERDPVVRVEGNVMDHLVQNVPISWIDLPDLVVTPTQAPIDEPTTAPTSEPGVVPKGETDDDVGTLLALISKMPWLLPAVTALIGFPIAYAVGYVVRGRRRRRMHQSGIYRT